MRNDPSVAGRAVLATTPWAAVAITVAFETAPPAGFTTVPLIVAVPMLPAIVGVS
ncbi:MAG: hypothetical protein NVS4B13_00020 [Candidatus Elarobacter sp.]